MNQVKKFATNPDRPFQIESELQVRKWLEKNTEFTFEFNRNDIQTGYDLTCWEYVQKGDVFEKRHICFIEVEESKQWKNGHYPEHWKNWAYLQRKVNKFDWDNSQFLSSLKTNAERTIYLKIAGDFSDMYCSRMEDINKHGKLYSSKTIVKRPYYDMTYRFSRSDKSPYVFHGHERCKKAILRFIDIQRNKEPIKIQIAS